MATLLSRMKLHVISCKIGIFQRKDLIMNKKNATVVLLLSSALLLGGCGGSGEAPASSEEESQASQTSEISSKCILAMEMDSGIVVTDLKGCPLDASYEKGTKVSFQVSGPKGKEISVALNGAPLEKGEEGYSFVIETDSTLKLALSDCTHKSLKLIDKVEPTEYKAGSLAYYYCLSCEESFLDAEGKDKIESKSNGIVKGDPRYLSPVQGEFCLINSNVAAYLNASSEKEQIEALKNTTPYNDQATKTLEWEGAANAKYCVDLSTDKGFASYKRFSVTTNKLALPGILVPGTTYYWRVLDDEENVLNDDYSFRVIDTLSLRTMNVEGMFNMRDLGGWTAQSGIKIPYGKIYRGGNFSRITDSGKEVFIEELGVKTEIDLRTNGTDVLNDDRIEYLKAGMWQYTMIIPGYVSPVAEDDGKTVRGYDPGSASSLKAIFEKLADKASYPVYFHCNAGADRTGTLAFLLEGLLGVSYGDLIKDFELTSFSDQGARYRSKVNGDSFDESGIFENTTGNLISFGKMHELIVSNYPTKNKTLVASIERYLKEVVRLSEETIERVRANILGDEVCFDPVSWDEEEEEERVTGNAFTFDNGRLTCDSSVTHEATTFEGKDCVKITMGEQGKIYFDLDALKTYEKIKFDVYIAGDNAKTLAGLGYFAFRVKPNDLTASGYLDYHDEGSRKVALDEWNSFEEDVSSYVSSMTEFSFVVPSGQAMYLANIAGE